MNSPNSSTAKRYQNYKDSAFSQDMSSQSLFKKNCANKKESRTNSVGPYIDTSLGQLTPIFSTIIKNSLPR